MTWSLFAFRTTTNFIDSNRVWVSRNHTLLSSQVSGPTRLLKPRQTQSNQLSRTARRRMEGSRNPRSTAATTESLRHTSTGLQAVIERSGSGSLTSQVVGVCAWDPSCHRAPWTPKYIMFAKANASVLSSCRRRPLQKILIGLASRSPSLENSRIPSKTRQPIRGQRTQHLGATHDAGAGFGDLRAVLRACTTTFSRQASSISSGFDKKGNAASTAVGFSLSFMHIYLQKPSARWPLKAQIKYPNYAIQTTSESHLACNAQPTYATKNSRTMLYEICPRPPCLETSGGTTASMTLLRIPPRQDSKNLPELCNKASHPMNNQAGLCSQCVVLIMRCPSDGIRHVTNRLWSQTGALACARMRKHGAMQYRLFMHVSSTWRPACFFEFGAQPLHPKAGTAR